MARKLVNSASVKNLALLASLTLVYFVAGSLVMRLAFVRPYVTPIWLPASIAFAAFILVGYRVWPAILLGSLLCHLTTIGFVLASFTIPAGATLEGLAGAYLVKRFAHGARAFDSAKGIFRFVLFACVCAPAISATLGVGRIYLAEHITWTDCGFKWFTWWLAHFIGILLGTPFLILLLRASHHRLDRWELTELAALLLGLVFVCLLVFSPLSLWLNKNHVVQAWLCLPFLVWAGFRFCPLEAAGTTLILFGSAIWGTLHGYGSFVAEDLTTSLFLLDTFIAVIGTMALVVAAMVVERRQIEGEILGTQSLLQKAIEEQERDLVVTVQALEMEAAGHLQTKRALRENQERIRRIAAHAKSDEKEQEDSTRGEWLE
ncbi:MAG: MASE1 domain-containing protein [Candidatus Acidiferrales bacterium]